jgi:hypothetical protein
MKKIYALAGAVLVAGVGFTQSPFKTNPHHFTTLDKYAPGAITVKPQRKVVNHDRAVYYTEDFDGGLNGWVGTIQVGTAGFGLTNTGHQNTPSNTFQIPPLVTSTPTNWILLDSDADGTQYTNPEEATFNSPEIDLTAAAGDFVALQFDQFFAEWDNQIFTEAGSEDHCFIAVSTDSTNWTEIEINDLMGRTGRPNPEFISWDITDAIAGNESTVYFRFRWEGAWNYGWQFDNVQVASIPERDLEIVDIWRPTSQLNPANGGTLYMYSQTPLAHTDTVVFGAIVRNTGHDTHTDVAVDFELTTPGGPQSGTSPVIASIPPSPDLDTILFSVNYVPDAVGSYTTEFTVVSNEGDLFSDNDSLVDDHFEVTDYIYAADYPVGAEIGCTTPPGIDNFQEMRFGNVFAFKTDDVLSGIDFKLTSNASNVGELVFAQVFAFDGQSGEWFSEWDNNGQPVYTVDAADLGNWVTVAVNAGNGLNVFETTEYYLVTVGTISGTTDPVFARQGDMKLGRVAGYGTVEASGNPGGATYFDRISPMVRARVNQNEVGIEEQAIQESFMVFPNPANTEINVAMNLDNADNTVVNVLDISGKVIKTMTLGTVNGQMTITVPLTDLANGVYFIEMANDNGNQVKKFVKK